MNFRIGTETMPVPLIRAFGILKRAAALDQQGARPARSAPCRRHRRGGAGGDRRQARRQFPARRLADRLRHADQHERQRGDRQPRDRDARRRARVEEAGPPERPRELQPVVERQLPDRDAHRRGGGDRAAPAAGACRRCRRRCSTQGGAVRPHHQDRPHAHAGRDAADARPGVFRLRGAARIRASGASRRPPNISSSWRRAAPPSAPG